MAKNYQRLWNEVTHAIDEAKSVRILAEILVDKEGRTFISRLDRKDAELCIEILDYVSRDLQFSLSPPHTISLIRASQNATSKPPRSRHSSSR